MRKHFKSDSIEFKFISGGDANAGNGGNGYNSGPVQRQYAEFDHQSVQQGRRQDVHYQYRR